ncbi:hypothetical protein J3B02_002704 [Coemansia erecta]|nr:hypothetical protein J3B02_002704 [Coemansia erecta]KAJ2886210.1 hypothetical protein FB639_001618 [Coemansia asiatica]
MAPGLAVAKHPVVDIKKSNGYHVDALLAQQGKADKVLLRRRIEFRLAMQPDAKMDMLRKKYKPINDLGAKSGHVDSDKTKAGSKSSLKQPKKDDADGGSLENNGLVENSGFRRAAHSLFPSERLSNGWKQVRPIGPGLNNLGNTCFLNSVLQCLTYTPSLAEYMLTREHSASCRAGDNCLLCRFEAHVVRALSKREGSSLSPKSIVGRLKLVAKHMRVGRQEDSHELLRLLIESFQRSLLYGIDPKIDRRIQETTLVHQVFGGYLQSQVKCSRCGYDSNTFEPNLDISLDIQSGGGSVTKALRAFIRPETLTKSNRYKCDKCSKLVDATKQMTIYRLPQTLTLQLKRFSIFGGGKINRFAEFPLSLNMESYVSSNSSESGPYIYNLYAVLVHAGGTARSGHYFCYVKSPAGVWYEMNDSMVHQVSERTVLKQNAYLLFYERDMSARSSTSLNKQASNGEIKKKKKKMGQEKQKIAADVTGREDLGQSVSSSAISYPLLASEDTDLIRLGSKKKNKNKNKNKDKIRSTEDRSADTAASSDVVNGNSHAAESSSKVKVKVKAANGLADAFESSSKEIDSLLHTSDRSNAGGAKEEKPESQQTDRAIKKIVADVNDNIPSVSGWTVRTKAADSALNKSNSKVISWNEDLASKQAKIAAIAESKAANGSWNVSSVRPDRLSQYGVAVESWNGDSSSSASIAANGQGKSEKDGLAAKKRNRRPDAYDAEYDRGRVKKVRKAKFNQFAATINPFQKVGERISKKKHK